MPAASFIRVLRPQPETPVAQVSGVGAANATRLQRLGIHTVGDLLMHLPRRYEDTRELLTIDQLRPSREALTVRAQVLRVGARYSRHTHMQLVEAAIADETGTARAVWFNQPFMLTRLHPGEQLVLSGRVRWRDGHAQLQSPSFEPVRGEQLHVGRIAPVYPETDGLTSRFLRARIENLLDVARELPDPVPATVRESEGLMTLGAALRQAHSPESLELVDVARETIAFGELFLLQLAAGRARRRRLAGRGAVVPYNAEVARELVAGLPFRLTDGQRLAAHEIMTEMAATGPMSRLLEGDVGSGKTVVAALAALMTARAGMQTLVMAPTEILARQHHVTMSRLLAPLGVSVRLLAGSTSARARREILAGVAAGHDSVLVGTHALLEDEVRPQSLGLVVVDEQHRFGVTQRQRLRRKATLMPNFLATTATPIPRSLALTLYGDVSVSELRELPKGRSAVATSVVAPDQRDVAHAFVAEQVAAGRQAFVICPLIEESDKLGVRAATQEWEHLRSAVFPSLRLELLHGRMPAREKEAAMARFAGGDADILVSTSVVEVGVDVPNASVMLIEGAERFGLAQLHQFRGRVGRDAHRSYCLLFQGTTDDEGRTRLEAVARTQSGFDIAELDLRLRGPGDVVGLRQHGLPEMRVADLLDQALLERARRQATEWLDADPELRAHPPLAAALNGYRAVFDLD